VQKIVTPKGEVLVILPLEEYERLVDAADVAAADKVRSDVRAGRDELVPAAIVQRLLSGENPVRVWRSHRSLSSRELADRTGLSAPYISEIENGKKDGSVAAIRKIAAALGVDIDDLT